MECSPSSMRTPTDAAQSWRNKVEISAHLRTLLSQSCKKFTVYVTQQLISHPRSAEKYYFPTFKPGREYHILMDMERKRNLSTIFAECTAQVCDGED